MKAPFDDTARAYDATFTQKPIGSAQRGLVWNYLRATYGNRFPLNVLELNCGTGEDAMFFAKQGSDVFATDVSQQMLEITRQKAELNEFSHLVRTTQLDISLLDPSLFSQKFDLVFSNFGGLNCVSGPELQSLLGKLPPVLNAHGRVILVVMPRFCAWECIYYCLQLDYRRAFRRRKRTVQKASLGNSDVNVWYHDPSDIATMAANCFELVHVQPIGITVPPSYMQNTVLGHSAIVNKLASLEKRIARFRGLSRMSDHYLIDLRLK